MTSSATTPPVLGGDYGAEEPAPLPPRHGLPGWSAGRAALRALDPRLTARLRAERQRDDALSAPLRRGRSIAVVGIAPGAGRSTVAALLAVALAQHQGRRILAIDTAGTGGLYRRLAARPGGSLDGVLVGLGVREPGPGRPRRAPMGWRWLRRRLSISADVLLLASDPGTGETPITRDEYVATVRALGRYVPVIVSDTPLLANDSVVPAVVATADRVVIVGPDDDQGARWVKTCLPWVAAISGHPPEGTVTGVLVGRAGGSARAPTDAPADTVPVFRLPYDPALTSALGVVRWHELAPRTRDAVYSLAVRLVRELTRA